MAHGERLIKLLMFVAGFLFVMLVTYAIPLRQSHVRAVYCAGGLVILFALSTAALIAFRRWNTDLSNSGVTRSRGRGVYTATGLGVQGLLLFGIALLAERGTTLRLLFNAGGGLVIVLAVAVLLARRTGS